MANVEWTKQERAFEAWSNGRFTWLDVWDASTGWSITVSPGNYKVYKPHDTGLEQSWLYAATFATLGEAKRYAELEGQSE